MKNLSIIVEQNKREAIDLLKQHGGRIDFVEGIIKNNPDNYEEDDFNGDIEDFDCPIVLAEGCEDVEKCAVLSAVYNEDNDSIDVWVRDTASEGSFLDVWTDCSFGNYSDDDVYQHIYDVVKGQ